MGYYIQTPGQKKGKAAYIVEHFAGKFQPTAPKSLSEISPDEVVICVIANDTFEAAAFCFSDRELEQFRDDRSGRPKTWVVMPLDQAKELKGYRD